jgi:hypothetical protein
MVGRRRRGLEAQQCFTDVRRTSARGHRCSPALAGEVEEDEAETEAGLPKHERRRKNHVALALEQGRELESEGRRYGVGRGSSGVYIGCWESTGEG